jgi:Molybdopterin-binding domain of aldehyde dehydrogenase
MRSQLTPRLTVSPAAFDRPFRLGGGPSHGSHVESDSESITHGRSISRQRRFRNAFSIIGEVVPQGAFFFSVMAQGSGLTRSSRRAKESLRTKAEDDIGFAAGRFIVKGTDRSVGLFDVAKAAADGKAAPQDLAVSHSASRDEMIKQLCFSYGAHVCEVEIDAQTGGVDLVRYAAVDDVGRAVRHSASFAPTEYAGSVAFCVIHGLRRAARFRYRQPTTWFRT